MGFVHADAPSPAALDEFETEPALADARIGDHPDHLPVRLSGAGEDRLEPVELGLAADEAREATRARRVQARAQGPDPFELVDGHGHAHALYRSGATVADGEEALDQAGRVLRQPYRSRNRELLHARGEADRVSLSRIVHAQVVADPTDHHLARVEARANRELEAVWGEPARIASQLGDDSQRRVTGAPGVILMRDGGPEQRHDAVAGELVDRPLEAMHLLGEDLEEAVENTMPFLGVDPLGEQHRVDHVGE